MTFLGTTGAVPQKDKAFASAVVFFRGEYLLFDAPEGTQKQLMASEVSLMKVNKVFISHMDADHFLGLFGWIATMTLNQRKEKLTIFSPKGGKEKIQRILHEVVHPCFEIEYKEIKKGLLTEGEGFGVSAFPLMHGVPCYGFLFKENDKCGEFNRKKAEGLGIPPGPLYAKLAAGEKVKVNGKVFTQKDVMDYSKKRTGRKIAIVYDTRPSKEVVVAAKGADLLVHEATFLETQKEKATEAMHSTALEAAQVAKKAGVKKLILFHFSARNTDENAILAEAKKGFAETKLAKELETITL